MREGPLEILGPHLPDLPGGPRHHDEGRGGGASWGREEGQDLLGELLDDFGGRTLGELHVERGVVDPGVALAESQAHYEEWISSAAQALRGAVIASSILASG